MQIITHFRDMVVIPTGKFWMGSPEAEAGRQANEGPRRSKQIRQPFALARRAVTVREFAIFTAATEEIPHGDCQIWNGAAWMHIDGNFTSSPLQQQPDAPAVLVSWHDAQRYIAYLAGQTGLQFRLPSEVEWEYAARAGSGTAYPWGNTFDPALVHSRRAPKGLHFIGGPVSATAAAPNAFGLHHMHGNIWEWVADSWRHNHDGEMAAKIAADLPGHDKRVVRGGSWLNGPAGVRSARRHAAHPATRRADIGFRLACTLPEDVSDH